VEKPDLSQFICVPFPRSFPDRGAERSLVMSVSVCPSVCLSARITKKPQAQTTHNFLFMLPMAVARSSSDGVVICHVLPVSWMIFSHNSPYSAEVRTFRRRILLVSPTIPWTFCRHIKLHKWPLNPYTCWLLKWPASGRAVKIEQSSNGPPEYKRRRHDFIWSPKDFMLYYNKYIC